jgi:hypothetical protein
MGKQRFNNTDFRKKHQGRKINMTKQIGKRKIKKRISMSMYLNNNKNTSIFADYENKFRLTMILFEL